MFVHDFARNIEQQFFPSERCPEPYQSSGVLLMHNNIRKGFPSSDRPQDRKRHRTFSVVAAAALGAMTLASCSPSSALSPDTVGSSSTESDAVQRSLDALVSEDGLPARPRKHPRPKRQLPQLHRRSR